MSRTIKKGATSQSLYFDVFDSTSSTGGRKTGLVFNTSNLVAYYARNGAASVQITLATLAAASTAWASGGFKEVDATNMPGLYRLDVPDAAFATGADSVVVSIAGATGMVLSAENVQLVAVDLQDTVRSGLTALPNAAAEAAGGLYTRGTGAGQINQDANGRVDVSLKAILGTALTETAGQIAAGFKKLFDVATPVLTAASVNQTGDAYARLGAPAGASHAADVAAVKAVLPAALVGGRIDASVGAVAAGAIAAAAFAANALDAVWSTATRVLTAGTNIALAKGTGVTGFNDLSAAQVNAEADTALADAGLTTTVTSRIDAAISTRSTYAGGDTAGTATLLSRLGAPVGASISADIAAVKAVDDAVKAKTDNLPADPADASDIASATGAIFTALGVVDGKVDDLPTNAELATALAGADDATLAAIAALNNLSAVQVNAEVDTALSDAGVTGVRMAHLDADITSRLAGGSYTAPDNASVTAIKAKTDNLPSDPADQSLIIAATDAVMTRLGAPAGASIAADIAGKATQASVDDLPTNAELATALGTADDATLAAIAAIPTAPTAASIADEVETRTLDANITQVNGTAVTGTGASGDEWGPA